MNTALCPKCRNSLSVKPGLKAGWCPVCHAGLKVYHPNPWEEKKSENVEIAGKNWKVKEIDVDGVPYVMVKPLDWGVTVPDGVNTFDKPAQRRRYLAEARKWLKAELLAGRTPTISHATKAEIAVAGQEGIRRIPLDKIKVKTELYQYRKGGSRQAGLDLKHVDNIAKGFTPNRMTPIELRALPDGTYELLSGHHRFAAFEQNHATGGIDKYPDYDFSTIPSLVRQVDDQTAQQLARLSNAATKEYSPSELAKIIDIEVKGGMPIEDVGRIYGNRKPSEVQKLLDVAVLPESLTAVLDQPAMRKVFTLDHAAVLGSAIKRYGLAPQEAKTIFDNLLSKGEYTANQLERMMTTLAPQIKEAPPDMFSGMALEKGGIISVMKDVMNGIKDEQKQNRQLSSFNNFILAAQKAGRAIPGELVAAQRVALSELNKIRSRIKDLQYSLGQRVKAQATANPIGDWRNALKALADKIERRARRNPSLPAKAGERRYYSPQLNRIFSESEVEKVPTPLGVDWRIGGKTTSHYPIEDFMGPKRFATAQDLYERGRAAIYEELKATSKRQGKELNKLAAEARRQRKQAEDLGKYGITDPLAQAGEAAAKEPWMMTVADFKASGVEYTVPNGPLRVELRTGPRTKVDFAGATRSDIDRKIKREHRWDVEDAIKRGKPVPAEVLKDYPDLTAKHERKAQKMSTGIFQGKLFNPWRRRRNPTVIPYSPTLNIKNTAQLSRGIGARYLLAIRGQGDDFIAERWARIMPPSLRPSQVVIDMMPGRRNPQLNKPIPMFQELEKIPFTPEAGMQKGFTETGAEFFQEYRPEGKGEAERMTPQDIYALGQWERTMGKRTPRIASKFGYRPGQKWIKWNPERLKS